MESEQASFSPPHQGRSSDFFIGPQAFSCVDQSCNTNDVDRHFIARLYQSRLYSMQGALSSTAGMKSVVRTEVQIQYPCEGRKCSALFISRPCPTLPSFSEMETMKVCRLIELISKKNHSSCFLFTGLRKGLNNWTWYIVREW